MTKDGIGHAQHFRNVFKDFRKYMRVIQVNDSLYQFVPDKEYKEVRVHGYENIYSPEQMKSRTLLPHKEFLIRFSLATISKCIILIGGTADSLNARGECHALNTVKSCWDAYKLPSLNTPRCRHSAVAMNNQVYVVSGHDGDRYFNSIEVLSVRVNGSGWVSWVSKQGW